MEINANKMWSLYLFNQDTPKNGVELLASVGWATCCPRIIKTHLKNCIFINDCKCDFL